MMFDDLKKSAEEIKMTDEMKKRLIKNIELEISNQEEFVMKNTNKGFKRMVPIVAAIVICAVSVGAGVITYFRGFKDVIKDGAVIDTVFNETSEMIVIEAEVDDNLIVTANILDSQSMPYSELDAIESIHYCVFDDAGEIIEKGRAVSTSGFVDGKVTFEVPLENTPDGEYKLVVNGFVGTKKADKPLTVCGTWECDFIK